MTTESKFLLFFSFLCSLFIPFYFTERERNLPQYGRHQNPSVQRGPGGILLEAGRVKQGRRARQEHSQGRRGPADENMRSIVGRRGTYRCRSTVGRGRLAGGEMSWGSLKIYQITQTKLFGSINKGIVDNESRFNGKYICKYVKSKVQNTPKVLD